MIRFVSSKTSRIAHSANVSPNSKCPPTGASLDSPWELNMFT
nr:hypothetical protein [Rickettsia endosymbiont of Proechinophthirus fluctus]